MAPAVRIDELTKTYGSVIGVERLTLSVDTGEIFGFLGANGAGKTTTIRLLLDLLRPTSGSASVLGFDCRTQSRDVRRRVGYLPGDMPFYPELTGARYLAFLSALGPKPPPSRIETLLRRFDMSDRDLKRRMREYSQGMKRKLGIVQALMTDAPVLILDEPTSGLDPLMIEAFGETIDEIAREGRATVFLSSHVLSEVDRTCQRIGVIRGGRLAAVQTLADLRASAPRRVTVLFSAAVHADVPAIVGATLVARHDDRWVLDVRGPISGLLSAIAPLPVQDLVVTPFTPEEAILRLFGGSRGMLTLVRRSLGRVPIVLASVVGLLAVFQIALIATARSFVASGNFAWLTQMAAPSFVRNTFGAAFTSFAGMSVLGFFEPLIIILVVQFAIYLATEPAGEVESGLLDLILARPVPRHALITRSMLVMTLGVVVATATMGVATWAGLAALAPDGVEWPQISTVRLLMVHFAALAWCFGGAALGCAAFVNRRTAAAATVGIAAIALYLAEFVGVSWPAVHYLATISPFHYFKGPEILEGVVRTGRNLTILFGSGIVGIVVAYVQFARRDIR